MFHEWGDCVTQDGVATLTCLPIVFQNIISALLLFVGATAGILIVWAGIKFVQSGGDQKQVASARQIMTYAIIGLILVLCSFGILNLIAYLTGVECITQLGIDVCL